MIYKNELQHSISLIRDVPEVWRGEYAPWSGHLTEITTHAVCYMHQLVVKNRKASPTNLAEEIPDTI